VASQERLSSMEVVNIVKNYCHTEFKNDAFDTSRVYMATEMVLRDGRT
jgi:hypothetical protein